MRYCVYFVPREGVHPTAKLSDYSLLWPIMHKSVRKLGHKLVHLTDLHTPSWGDEVWRTDVDPATTVYSRDVAWARYVEALPEGEQACMIEPDTILLRDIPPVKDKHDLVLLKRDKGACGWFKLAKRSAAPFFRIVVDEYFNIPVNFHSFHGDLGALERAQRRGHGCRIEWRDWHRYGFRKDPNSDPYLLQFKGTSKSDMLAYENP